MRKQTLLTFSFLLFNYIINAQIVVTPVNKYFTCCGINPQNNDSVDVGNDNIADLFFFTQGTPNFSYGFYCQANQGTVSENYRLTDPKILGNPFPLPLLYNGFCYLSENIWDADYWQITGGIRYMGIRHNIGTDSIYGWVKLDYKKTPNSPDNDTIKIVEYAFNTIVNEPILAGQTAPNELKVINKENGFAIYPNPCSDLQTIEIINTKADPIIIELFDISGRKMAVVFKGTCKIGKTNIKYNLSHLVSGIYHYKIQLGDNIHYAKTSKSN